MLIPPPDQASHLKRGSELHPTLKTCVDVYLCRFGSDGKLTVFPYGDKNRKKPPKHLRNQVAEDKQLLWEEKAGQESETGQ